MNLDDSGGSGIDASITIQAQIKTLTESALPVSLDASKSLASIKKELLNLEGTVDIKPKDAKAFQTAIDAAIKKVKLDGLPVDVIANIKNPDDLTIYVDISESNLTRLKEKIEKEFRPTVDAIIKNIDLRNASVKASFSEESLQKVNTDFQTAIKNHHFNLDLPVTAQVLGESKFIETLNNQITAINRGIDKGTLGKINSIKLPFSVEGSDKESVKGLKSVSKYLDEIIKKEEEFVSNLGTDKIQEALNNIVGDNKKEEDPKIKALVGLYTSPDQISSFVNRTNTDLAQLKTLPKISVNIDASESDLQRIAEALKGVEAVGENVTKMWVGKKKSAIMPTVMVDFAGEPSIKSQFEDYNKTDAAKENVIVANVDISQDKWTALRQKFIDLKTLIKESNFGEHIVKGLIEEFQKSKDVVDKIFKERSGGIKVTPNYDNFDINTKEKLDLESKSSFMLKVIPDFTIFDTIMNRNIPVYESRYKSAITVGVVPNTSELESIKLTLGEFKNGFDIPVTVTDVNNKLTTEVTSSIDSITKLNTAIGELYNTYSSNFNTVVESIKNINESGLSKLSDEISTIIDTVHAVNSQEIRININDNVSQNIKDINSDISIIKTTIDTLTKTFEILQDKKITIDISIPEYVSILNKLDDLIDKIHVVNSKYLRIDFDTNALQNIDDVISKLSGIKSDDYNVPINLDKANEKVDALKDKISEFGTLAGPVPITLDVNQGLLLTVWNKVKDYFEQNPIEIVFDSAGKMAKSVNLGKDTDKHTLAMYYQTKEGFQKLQQDANDDAIIKELKRQAEANAKLEAQRENAYIPDKINALRKYEAKTSVINSKTDFAQSQTGYDRHYAEEQEKLADRISRNAAREQFKKDYGVELSVIGYREGFNNYIEAQKNKRMKADIASEFNKDTHEGELPEEERSEKYPIINNKEKPLVTRKKVYNTDPRAPEPLYNDTIDHDYMLEAYNKRLQLPLDMLDIDKYAQTMFMTLPSVVSTLVEDVESKLRVALSQSNISIDDEGFADVINGFAEKIRETYNKFLNNGDYDLRNTVDELLETLNETIKETTDRTRAFLDNLNDPNLDPTATGNENLEEYHRLQKIRYSGIYGVPESFQNGNIGSYDVNELENLIQMQNNLDSTRFDLERSQAEHVANIREAINSEKISEKPYTSWINGIDVEAFNSVTTDKPAESKQEEKQKIDDRLRPYIEIFREILTKYGDKSKVTEKAEKYLMDIKKMGPGFGSGERLKQMRKKYILGIDKEETKYQLKNKLGAAGVGILGGMVQGGASKLFGMLQGLLNRIKGMLIGLVRKTINLAINPFKKSVKMFTGAIKSAGSKSKTLSSLSELLIMPLVLAMEFTMLPVLKKLIPAIKETMNWVVNSKDKFILLGEAIANVANKVYNMLTGNFVLGFEKFFKKISNYEEWITDAYSNDKTLFTNLNEAGVALTNISDNLETLATVANNLNEELIAFSNENPESGNLIASFADYIGKALFTSITTSTEAIWEAFDSVLNNDEAYSHLQSFFEGLITNLGKNIETTSKIGAEFVDQLVESINNYLSTSAGSATLKNIAQNLADIISNAMKVAADKIIPQVIGSGAVGEVAISTMPIWGSAVLLGALSKGLSSGIGTLFKNLGNKVLGKGKTVTKTTGTAGDTATNQFASTKNSADLGKTASDVTSTGSKLSKVGRVLGTIGKVAGPIGDAVLGGEILYGEITAGNYARSIENPEQMFVGDYLEGLVDATSGIAQYGYVDQSLKEISKASGFSIDELKSLTTEEFNNLSNDVYGSGGFMGINTNGDAWENGWAVPFSDKWWKLNNGELSVSDSDTKKKYQDILKYGKISATNSDANVAGAETIIDIINGRGIQINSDTQKTWEQTTGYVRSVYDELMDAGTLLSDGVTVIDPTDEKVLEVLQSIDKSLLTTTAETGNTPITYTSNDDGTIDVDGTTIGGETIKTTKTLAQELAEQYIANPNQTIILPDESVRYEDVMAEVDKIVNGREEERATLTQSPYFTPEQQNQILDSILALNGGGTSWVDVEQYAAKQGLTSDYYKSFLTEGNANKLLSNRLAQNGGKTWLETVDLNPTAVQHEQESLFDFDYGYGSMYNSTIEDLVETIKNGETSEVYSTKAMQNLISYSSGWHREFVEALATEFEGVFKENGGTSFNSTSVDLSNIARKYGIEELAELITPIDSMDTNLYTKDTNNELVLKQEITINNNSDGKLSVQTSNETSGNWLMRFFGQNNINGN